MGTRLNRGFAILVLAALAAAWSGAAPALAQTIKVGVLTDRVGNAAYYAGLIEQGINLAVKEVNAAGGVLGRKIELQYEDDQNKPDLSATKARKLIDDGVAIILSISSSTCTQQAETVTVEAKVPHIAPNNTLDTLTTRLDNPYFFQLGPLSSDQVRTLIAFTGNKYKRVAEIYDGSGISRSMANDFKSEMTKAGIQVVDEELIEVGSTDVVPQLQRIRAVNPDAIVSAAISIPETTLFFRGLNQLGLKYPVLGSFNLSTPAYLELAPNLLNGAAFVDVLDPDKPQAKAYFEKYVAEYKKTPFSMTSSGYDAINLFADALKRAGSADHEKLRQAIAATRSFEGVEAAKGTTLGFPAGKRTGFPPKGSVVRMIENNAHGKVIWSGY